MESKKILIVDDEPGIRDLLSYQLQVSGYEVESAEDGVECLEKIEKKYFDIIVCDIKMPRLDGIQTLQKIKTISPTSEVIITTGFCTDESAIQSLQKGAYAYLAKPFDLDELMNTIEKALAEQEK